MLLVLSLKGGSHSFISFWARIVNQGSGFLTNGFKVIFFFREREREREGDNYSSYFDGHACVLVRCVPRGVTSQKGVLRHRGVRHIRY